MGQVLVRNIPEAVIEAFKMKARLKGTSLEQYLREFLAQHATMGDVERLAFVRGIRDSVTKPSAPMTKDEIREGLE